MSSTTIAMMLAAVLAHRHSEAVLGPDLARDRPAASAQTFASTEGDHRPETTTDGDTDTYWRVRDGSTTGTIEIQLAGPRPIDHVVLCEPEALVDRVRRFSIQGRTVDGWTTIARGTTVGRRRVVQFPTVVANRVRVTIEHATDEPGLSRIGVHSGPPKVAIVTDFPAFLDRTTVFLTADRDHARIHYTLDGTVPDRSSTRYRGGAIRVDDDLLLRAIAFEGDRPSLDAAMTRFTRFESVAALEPRHRLDASGLAFGIVQVDRDDPGRPLIVDRIFVRPVAASTERGMRFDGMVRIPRDGVFDLHFETDGMVEVEFTDSGDAPWTPTSARRSLRRPFRSGWHPIRIEWTGRGEDRLEIEIEGPRTPRRSVRNGDFALEPTP